jgi:hypothetical protein
VVDLDALGTDDTLQVLVMAGRAPDVRHSGSIAICDAGLSEVDVEGLLEREHGLPHHSRRHVTAPTRHVGVRGSLRLCSEVTTIVAGFAGFGAGDPEGT